MNTSASARKAILARIRSANAGRENFEHPGDFGGWRPADPVGVGLKGAVDGAEESVDARDAGATDADTFTLRFERVGGEVARVAGLAGARSWLASFVTDFAGAALGTGVPSEFRSLLPTTPPESAPLAISMARAGIAETGSLVMDARDGRRTQLLCPTHVVLLRASDVFSSARSAFAALSADLPSAVGLHSGPSKSADIGQVMVKGVHGPARVIALIIEEGATS